MSAYFQSVDTEMPSLPRRKISAWIKAVAAGFGKTAGEITYIFCSDEKILEMNREYLRHDYYTDIITFDYTEGDKISGDLFISMDTIRSNASLFGVSVDEELYRVMIHGILHLCGVNDKAPGERELMEAEEDKAMKLPESPAG